MKDEEFTGNWLQGNQTEDEMLRVSTKQVA